MVILLAAVLLEVGAGRLEPGETHEAMWAWRRGDGGLDSKNIWVMTLFLFWMTVIHHPAAVHCQSSVWCYRLDPAQAWSDFLMMLNLNSLRPSAATGPKSRNISTQIEFPLHTVILLFFLKITIARQLASGPENTRWIGIHPRRSKRGRMKSVINLPSRQLRWKNKNVWKKWTDKTWGVQLVQTNEAAEEFSTL